MTPAPRWAKGAGHSDVSKSIGGEFLARLGNFVKADPRWLREGAGGGRRRGARAGARTARDAARDGAVTPTTTLGCSASPAPRCLIVATARATSTSAEEGEGADVISSAGRGRDDGAPVRRRRDDARRARRVLARARVAQSRADAHHAPVRWYVPSSDRRRRERPRLDTPRDSTTRRRDSIPRRWASIRPSAGRCRRTPLEVRVRTSRRSRTWTKRKKTPATTIMVRPARIPPAARDPAHVAVARGPCGDAAGAGGRRRRRATGCRGVSAPRARTPDAVGRIRPGPSFQFVPHVLAAEPSGRAANVPRAAASRRALALAGVSAATARARGRGIGPAAANRGVELGRVLGDGARARGARAGCVATSLARNNAAVGRRRWRAFSARCGTPRDEAARARRRRRRRPRRTADLRADHESRRRRASPVAEGSSFATRSRGRPGGRGGGRGGGDARVPGARSRRGGRWRTAAAAEARARPTRRRRRRKRRTSLRPPRRRAEEPGAYARIEEGARGWRGGASPRRASSAASTSGAGSTAGRSSARSWSRALAVLAAHGRVFNGAEERPAWRVPAGCSRFQRRRSEGARGRTDGTGGRARGSRRGRSATRGGAGARRLARRRRGRAAKRRGGQAARACARAIRAPRLRRGPRARARRRRKSHTPGSQRRHQRATFSSLLSARGERRIEAPRYLRTKQTTASPHEA